MNNSYDKNNETYAKEKFQKLSQINERSKYFNYDINNCNRFTSKYDENIFEGECG